MTVPKRRLVLILGVPASLLLAACLLWLMPATMAKYWGRRGEQALRSRQLNVAETCFVKASAWDQRHGELTLRRARIARLQADPERMRRLLQQARRQGASRAACRREEFLWRVQSGRAGELLGSLQEQLDAAGEDAPAVLQAYAAGFHASGDSMAAMDVLNRWLQQQPDAALAHLEKGLIYLDLEQTGEAEHALRQALANDPQLLEANLAMGRLAFTSEECDQALRYFRQVVQLEPSNLEARLSMASLLLRFKRTQQAVAEFQSVLADHPDSYPARLQLASHFAKQQQAQRVIELIEPLMPRFDDEVALNYLLATAYDQLGKDAAAEPYLQKFVIGRAELDRLLEWERNANAVPGDFETCKELGLGFLKYEWDSASRWLAAAMAINPIDVELNVAMAELAEKRGDAEQASEFARVAEALRRRANPGSDASH